MYSLLLALVLTLRPPTELLYHKLQWSEFLASKPVGKDAIAETRTQLEITFTEEDGKVTYVVYAVFLPEESFTATEREDILKHEQGHFDLCETMALECTKRLKDFTGSKEKAMKIFNHYAKQVDYLNDLYDRETLHSMNGRIQQLWFKHISEQLNKLQ